MARDGWDCSELSGPATLPCAPTSASTPIPRAAAASADITTTAHAPSEICEAEPAVIVPSAPNAGGSLPSASAVVSGRTPSSASNRIGSPRRGGALMRPGRELVLLGAADAQAGIMGVGELAHRGMVERVGQAVECHGVG